MLNLKEKIFVGGVVLVLVAGVWALCASLNKKMIEACVADGHSVDHCEFQVLYK